MFLETGSYCLSLRVSPQRLGAFQCERNKQRCHCERSESATSLVAVEFGNLQLS